MSYKPLWLLMLVLSLACGPRFAPKYEWGFNGFRHLESVPIVVVARIERNAVTVLGKKPFLDESVPDDPLALLKIRMSVENVLKGTVPLGDTEFFYISEAFPHGPRGDGFFSAGSFRDILLLRKDKGKLRLMRDIRAHCAAPLFSGAHPNFSPRPGEPMSEQLIDLLLTPGVGATEIGMLRAIFESTPFDISPSYAAQRLLQLAASGTPVVRTAACLQFRDKMADLATANAKEELVVLSKQFGLSSAIVEHWEKLQEQNGPARIWWAAGPLIDRLPSASLPADGPAGLSLCTNDKALGVPPLRNP